MNSILDSKKIKQLRQAAGIDQDQLASIIGKSPVWVTFVETKDDPRHGHLIRLEDLEALASAFKVQPHELIKNA